MRLYSILLLLFLTTSVNAQNWSIGAAASGTTWNKGFEPLVPGWPGKVHPGGLVSVKYKHFFVEFGADPHAYREATTGAFGLQYDLYHYNRVTVFSKFSVGGMLTPDFLEEGYGYHFNGQGPKYCWWWAVGLGTGISYRLNRRWSLEPLRVDYLAPQEVGERWRISSGFRVHF